MNEIERKFLIKFFPSIKNKKYYDNERFFLNTNNNIEERIYKKEDNYFFEKKNNISIYERKREKIQISENKFKELKKWIIWKSKRRTYYIYNNPKITIQVYKWKLKWLIRVEVEFKNINDCLSFKPLYWMWREITGTVISRDIDIIKKILKIRKPRNFFF